MKTLVVVDDEILVRVGLKALHDWESSGYSIVGEASSVREALPLIATMDPDLVLTDLVMNPEDGFVLIRRLKEAKSRARIVILSCRNDFEAVRTAMREGADDYVFKLTMQAEEMLEVFEKVLKKPPVSPEAEPAPLSPLPAQELPAFPCSTELEQGKPVAAELWKPALGSRADWIWGPERYRLLRLQSSAPASRPEPAFSNLPRLLSELSRRDLPEFLVWPAGSGVILCLIKGGTKEALVLVFEAIKEYASRYAGLSLSGGGSASHRSPDTFSQAWVEAREAVDHDFRGGKSPSFFEEIPPLETLDLAQLYRAMEDFRHEVMTTLDPNNLQSLATQFFSRLKVSRGASPDFLFQLVWDLLLPLRERLIGSADGSETGWAGTLARGFEPIRSCLHLLELETWTAGAIEATVRQIRRAEEGHLRPEIRAVIRWMEGHLGEPLSVEEAAVQIPMSASHFAHVFKEETGVSFLKFVIRRKMDLASLLLTTTDLLVYEIAQKVGYENANHFSTLFKQTTGLSPQELRGSRIL